MCNFSVIFVAAVVLLCGIYCIGPCTHHQWVLLEPSNSTSNNVKCNGSVCFQVNVSNIQDTLGPFNVCHISIKGIDDLSGFRFDSLDKLRSLDLSGNGIANLNITSFNLGGLEALDLTNNRIEVIEDAQFRTLPSLKVLNLGANVIDTLSVNAFVGLSVLQSLDLSKNRLRTVSFRCFLPLQTLQVLNVSRNFLTIADNSHFDGLQKLQQLDLSWNNLTRVDPGSMQFPNLLHLLLVGNPRIGGSYELYLGPGKILQNVDVSGSGLQRIPSALTQTIRTMRLRNNFLKSINRGDFDSYPLIQVIDLSNNYLETIEDDAFGRLDLLRILYLTENKLKVVPRSLPIGLTTLHIERNAIQTISKEDFVGLSTLEVLFINDNKIETIDPSSLSPLVGLFTLDLSRNPLKSIPSVILSFMNHLQILKLSYLDAAFDPESSVLPLLDHLTVLIVSGSPKLARQFLNSTAFLLSAREIQKIDARGADIVHIRSDLLSLLPQLHTFLLQDNPLNCSDLFWLATWLRRQESTQTNAIICRSPLEMKNMPLIDLQKIVSYDTMTKNKTLSTLNKKSGRKLKPAVNKTLLEKIIMDKSTKEIVRKVENSRKKKNCTYSVKRERNNQVSNSDNRANLVSDKPMALEKCAEQAKVHEDKGETRFEGEGQQKALQDNGRPFAEQNANNFRQTAYDNLAAKIAPFTLMNSKKGIPGTQINPLEWYKGSSGRNITRANGDNFPAPDTSPTTKDLISNKSHASFGNAAQISINNKKLQQKNKTAITSTVDGDTIENVSKKEVTQNEKSTDRIALAMTESKGETQKEFKGHFALIAFIFVLFNAVVVVAIVAFRTRFYCSNRCIRREEIEVTNLPGDLW